MTVAGLVAGVDSSTQACKVVVREASTGRLVREGRAPHPPGTEVAPAAWQEALWSAVDAAGGLAGVEAVAVAGQQHGMVCLDDDGAVVRPALLWNDVRSAQAARDLTTELGGPAVWAQRVGLVPVASFTVTKLRWLAEHEPAAADRTRAVCLPHDWLTWRLAGSTDLADLHTDRSDASGTGYWSAADDAYQPDLLRLAFGRDLLVPGVLGASAESGRVAAAPRGSGSPRLGAGAGDNAAAALGLGARPGDVIVSVGTSGVVSAIAEEAVVDPTGTVAGFADATGRHLPLVAMLNAARVLDAVATLLGVDHDGLSTLAMSAPPGSGGAVLVPYLEGERTPDRPDATGALHGLSLATTTPATVARAAVEGLLCGLADGLDAVRACGVEVRRVLLVGGGARSEALRSIAPAVLGCPVDVPRPGEYVADGAARQAAWLLAGSAEPPEWLLADVRRYEADPVPQVRERYAEVRELTANRLSAETPGQQSTMPG